MSDENMNEAVTRILPSRRKQYFLNSFDSETFHVITCDGGVLNLSFKITPREAKERNR